MAGIKSSTAAILGVLFALALTFYGWFMVAAIGSYMPIAIMKVLFWIGFFLTWLLCLVLNPILMITKGEGDWGDSAFGMISFFVGSFGMMISYYIIPPVLEVLDNLTLLSTGIWSSISNLGWMFLIIIWILGVMIIPNYKVVRSHTN